MLLSRLLIASALLLAAPWPAPTAELASFARRDRPGRPGRRPPAPPADQAAAEPAGDAPQSQPAPPGGRDPASIVIEINRQPVTHARYLEVLAAAEPAWQWLEAMPEDQRTGLIGRRTREETALIDEFAAPELMRLIFSDQDEDRKRRADEMYRRALAGESWRALVREYTLEPRAADGGGRTGPRLWYELPRPLGRRVFQAQLGEILPPILTPFGWHVARVAAVYPARNGQPERRDVSQALLMWTPEPDVQGREQDLRVIIADQTQRRLAIAVLDQGLCAELPNICAQNAEEAAKRAKRAEAGAAADGDTEAAPRADPAGER